ncbi:MAG TPA: NYN domain-containing protein [Candidatus Acidoferrum sp.]|nr:NYN domain-containing protein [Candidatus Acidoferrum sp.]
MSDSGRKTIVYIDGYNWYHAIFKHYPEWKWLNIQTLFEALRPHENIHRIKFFTALVDEHRPDSEARERHQKYISALKSLNKVSVILGKFQLRTVTCRAECGKPHTIPEEKKTDVNIAVHILSDAFKNECDSIVLVSGDSDAQPPIQWVKENCPDKKIVVYIPALPPDRERRRLDFYSQRGIDCKFFPIEVIQGHQFPNVVKIAPGQFVCRPPSWSKPN